MPHHYPQLPRTELIMNRRGAQGDEASYQGLQLECYQITGQKAEHTPSPSSQGCRCGSSHVSTSLRTKPWHLQWACSLWAH